MMRIFHEWHCKSIITSATIWVNLTATVILVYDVLAEYFYLYC